ncbi:MAG: 2-C-methyl-D-erythritol 4-phosphate cytidylyltransferase [Butyrivibrio sp.]|jgi:2-C-methyl-D-erythritol 4-phosphate cytidylyltransferase|nr:2-C-methyl-D-erythritol 4-phosphate cytidylyltransferase [Butyrivibrio sp.]
MIKNVGVLLAAGLGSRFGSDVPKQFLQIDGQEVISYGISAFRHTANLDVLLVLLGKEEYEAGTVARKYDVETVCGGASRAESFQNALDYIGVHYPDCEKVIFHEAARPLIHSEVFEKYFDLLDEYDYIETCQHITDSLGSYLPEIPVRENFFLIQAPEAYRYQTLVHFFDVKSEIYFAAYQLPASCRGYKYFDVGANFKLTYPSDLGLISYYIGQEHKAGKTTS